MVPLFYNQLRLLSTTTFPTKKSLITDFSIHLWLCSSKSTEFEKAILIHLASISLAPYSRSIFVKHTSFPPSHSSFNCMQTLSNERLSYHQGHRITLPSILVLLDSEISSCRITFVFIHPLHLYFYIRCSTNSNCYPRKRDINSALSPKYNLTLDSFIF